MKTLVALLALIVAATAVAEPRECRHRREESHNYIIERQQSYQVEGVPTSRLIIGRREIDVYSQSNGSKIMFEKNNVVGVKP